VANSSQLLCRGGNVSPRSGSFQSCEEKTEWLKLLSPGAWHESVVQENIEVGLLCLRPSLLALNRPCSVFQCCLFLNIDSARLVQLLCIAVSNMLIPYTKKLEFQA